MAEFPWFPCYPSDWLSSQTVQLLTLEQEGAFFRLLCYAWLNDACALPKDERLLRRLSKWDETDQDFAPVLACFKTHPSKPDHLYNCRLYREWQASRDRQAMLTSRATKGAEARWAEKPKRPVSIPTTPPAFNDFESFWSAYPKKIGKKAALTAWNKATDKPAVGVILKSLLSAQKSEQWRKDNGQYIPHPATWLHQGRWNDEPLTSRNGGTRRPPPPPPKTDPIGRGLWGRTYGDPRSHGYD